MPSAAKPLLFPIEKKKSRSFAYTQDDRAGEFFISPLD
jgi:hypothetical protein